MSDFLARLAERAIGAASDERVLPATPFRFAPGEPGLAPPSSDAGDDVPFDVAVDPERTSPPAVQRPQPRRAAAAADHQPSPAEPSRDTGSASHAHDDSTPAPRGHARRSAAQPHVTEVDQADAAVQSAAPIAPGPVARTRDVPLVSGTDSPALSPHPTVESRIAPHASTVDPTSAHSASDAHDPADDRASTDTPASAVATPPARRRVPAIQPAVEHEPPRISRALESTDARVAEHGHEHPRTRTADDEPAAPVRPTVRSMQAERVIRPVVVERAPATAEARPSVQPRAMPAAPMMRPRLEPVAPIAAKEPPSDASGRGDDEAQLPAAAPTIHVSIGRVEVRAVSAPAAGVRPRPASASTPAVSLDDYLRSRDGGRR